MILEAGSPYLRGHTRIFQDSPGEVTFSRSILEPGDFFILKFLLLHSNSEEPRVLPIGKIAGIKRIFLTHRDKEDGQRPAFLDVAFLGSVWVQLTRAASYSFASVIFIVIIVGSSASLGEALSKWRRRKVVRAFKEYAAPRLTGSDELFFDSFVDYGSYGLLEILSLLSGGSRLKRALLPKINDQHEDLTFRRRSLRAYYDSSRLLRRLVDKGIIVRDESGINKVDAERKEVLADFVGFLRRKGFIQDRPTKIAEMPNVSNKLDDGS